jgi:hypothetical protein
MCKIPEENEHVQIMGLHVCTVVVLPSDCPGPASLRPEVA